MKEIIALLLHLLLRSAKFLKRSGARALLAENLLLKHQLLVLQRSRRRAPNLHRFDLLLFGFWTSFLSPRRLFRAAVVLKPSTLLRFHRLLRQCKYRFLYSSHPKRKPGPRGPSPELIQAICEFKRRNPRFGCPRIAQHLVKSFGLEINKDVVRRVLARHYRPGRRDGGPSWLTFLGHAKDSLWSLDLFRTESILLKSHWVLVVMDQFSRRIIGFGVQAVAVDGAALCRMFNQAISGQGLPVRLSLDHDPLFQFQRWQANLRILGIAAVQTVPMVPWSHPFVERLIRSIREEYLDQLFFWNGSDLEQKLAEYRSYFNESRVHQGSQARGRQGPHVAPRVLVKIVGPDRRIVEIKLPPPLPPMAAAEKWEPQVSTASRIEDVLGVATDPGWREIRFLDRPLGVAQVESPNFGSLFTAAALIVSTIAHQQMMPAVPHARAFIAQPGRSWCRGQWSPFNPRVGGLR